MLRSVRSTYTGPQGLGRVQRRRGNARSVKITVPGDWALKICPKASQLSQLA